MSVFESTKQYQELLEQIQKWSFVNELAQFKESYPSEDGYIWALIDEHSMTQQSKKQPIAEELTRSEIDKADRMRGSYHSQSRYELLRHNPIAKQAFDESKDGRERIRIPLTLSNENSYPNLEVKKHLSQFGYESSLEDYAAGIAKKKVQVGDPDRGIPMQEKTVSKRIGSILDETKASTELKKSYMNDPVRSSSKTSEYDLIISHHPTDVYGMSTGRGWMSCANMRGEAKSDAAAKKMKHEIENLTHVAYLLPRGGDVNTDAIARIKLSPHHALGGVSHSVVIPESTVYGQAPSGFKKAVEEHTERLFPKLPNTIYRKEPSIYSDNGQPIHFPVETPSAEHLDTAWSHFGPKSEERNDLFAYVQPGQKYKSKKLNVVSQKIASAKQYADQGQFENAVDEFHSLHYELNGPELRGLQYGYRNTSLYHDTIKHIAHSANIQDHSKFVAEKLNRRYTYGTIGGDILQATHNRFIHQPVKTPEDLVSHTKYTTHMYSDRNEIPYDAHYSMADDHKFGGNVFMKSLSALSAAKMLTPKTFHQVYLSIPSHHRKGNLYDSAIHASKNGIPEADFIIDHLTHELSNSSPEKKATALYHSKPDTRRIFADKMGVDAQKVIQPFRQKFKEQEKYLSELRNKEVK